MRSSRSPLKGVWLPKYLTELVQTSYDGVTSVDMKIYRYLRPFFSSLSLLGQKIIFENDSRNLKNVFLRVNMGKNGLYMKPNGY